MLSACACALLCGCSGLIEDSGQAAGDDGGQFDGSSDAVLPGDVAVSDSIDPNEYEVTSDPGTRTLQRLNSTEYNNTVRDLLGVTTRPADDFPTDDRGYGFDNIARVLAMSPLLVEMYERSAELLVNEVMYVNTVMPEAHYFAADGPDVTATAGGSGSGGWNLWSNGELTTVLELESSGRYRISARAFGQQAGNETVQMVFLVDGSVVQTVSVAATSHQTYETEVHVAAGVREIGVGFINDYYDEAAGQDRNLVVEGFTVEGPLDVMPEDNPLRSRIVTCELEGSEGRACAAAILGDFARRAWRRPLAQGELDRLMTFVDLATTEGDPVEVGVRLALRAILLSPHFLFKVELDPEPEARVVHPLNDFELATRLSYFLWRSMPDEELFALAEAGRLQDRDTIAAQVERMLDDPRAESLVQDFAGQWLWIKAIDEAVPDLWYYPQWTPELQADMRTEAELTFRTLYLQEDQSLLGLLTGRETFVNNRLAAHYGLPAVSQGGDDTSFVRVDLSGTNRVGWLTQGALLTSTSYATRTSPVRRGQWVLQNLLCREPPAPPPGVEGIPQDNPDNLSLRERMLAHQTDPICASCHTEMDPIGFALEHYDGIGAWRDTDGAWAIDPSGELPGGAAFADHRELAELLASDPAFAECAIRKGFIYAIGRGPRTADKPYREAMARAFAERDYRLSELLTQVATSEPFRLRRGGAE